MLSESEKKSIELVIVSQPAIFSAVGIWYLAIIIGLPNWFALTLFVFEGIIVAVIVQIYWESGERPITLNKKQKNIPGEKIESQWD